MRDSAFQELLNEFVLEARERTDEVESLLLRLESADRSARGAALAQAKRELHTLKGNSGMMGFTDLQQLAHGMEDRVEALDLDAPEVADLLSALDRFRRELEARLPRAEDGEAAPGPLAEDDEVDETRARDLVGASVRVPFTRIDRLVEMLAEAVIFRNRLADAISRGLAHRRHPSADPAVAEAQVAADWEDVERAHQALEKSLNVLQEQVTELGMVPLQSLFRRLGRIVHDESAREGKRAELEIEGGETPLDKTLLEAAAEALGHLVRNAVIHGIEPPEERRRRGKPEVGRIRVEASLAASQVRIEVLDDGGGIDAEALAAKSGDRELASPYDLLFEEGFSTRGGADLSAGRGVGLSAVRKTVESHGGRVEVRSQPGRGSGFALRLPVVASILRSLLVGVDGESYALPLAAVAETLVIDPAGQNEVNGARVVRWRGRLVPLLDLGSAFGTAVGVRADGYVLLVEVNGRYRGLTADDILGIRDIVVKGLDRVVGQPAGISGSTILGDGRVILILDPSALTSLPPTPVHRGAVDER